MHATTQLENTSAWVVECSLDIQVTTGVAGNFCLVEHLQSQNLSIPAVLQYTFPEVSDKHSLLCEFVKNCLLSACLFLKPFKI